MAKLTIQEQETLIHIDEESKMVNIYCSSPRWWKKLDKVAKRSKVHKNSRTIVAVEYDLPEKYIKVSAPRKRNLTDKQKEEARERMKKVRSKIAKKQK